ncbi:MAG: hypothetical protein JXR40_04925, partial [Pontiellaceae bacterium]|nr:hypothetical protein [Pontiellaceae bacterium]
CGTIGGQCFQHHILRPLSISMHGVVRLLMFFYRRIKNRITADGYYGEWLLVGEWTTTKHIQAGSDGVLQSLNNIAGDDFYDPQYGGIYASTNGVLDTPKHTADIFSEPAWGGTYPRLINYDYSCTTPPVGQGRPQNRPITFPEHWVIEVGSLEYDPSYGVSGLTREEYEDRMIPGYKCGELFTARTNETSVIEIRFGQ